MRSFRFSIANLLLFIVALGVSFAALRNPSQLWANAWFSVALATLTIAVLAAVYRRGKRRAFWVGFASCGWLYLVLALGPWLESAVGSFLVTTAILDVVYPQIVPAPPPPASSAPASGMGGGMPGGTMMTAPGTGFGAYAPPPSAPGMMGSGMMMTGGAMSAVPPPSAWSNWTVPDQYTGLGESIGNVPLVSSEPFRRIGHSLFALLCALLGGALARRFASTREVDEHPAIP